MIAYGDVPALKNPAFISYNANMDATDTSNGHSQCPSNRHSFHTDLAFCDGHADSPVRNLVRNPDMNPSNVWRRRWNNDYQLHNEVSWIANPSWLNTPDQ
jgi:prepilin-type processing-associated H-X9-DG protein